MELAWPPVTSEPQLETQVRVAIDERAEQAVRGRVVGVDEVGAEGLHEGAGARPAEQVAEAAEARRGDDGDRDAGIRPGRKERTRRSWPRAERDWAQRRVWIEEASARRQSLTAGGGH